MKDRWGNWKEYEDEEEEEYSYLMIWETEEDIGS